MLLLCKYVTEKYTEIFFLFHKLSKAQIQFKGLFISKTKSMHLCFGALQFINCKWNSEGRRLYRISKPKAKLRTDSINLKIRLENATLALHGTVTKEICNTSCTLWHFEGLECLGLRLWIVHNAIGWYLMGKLYLTDKKARFFKKCQLLLIILVGMYL